MATSFGTYAMYPTTFDPDVDPKTPWDTIVYVCGLAHAKRKALPHVCKTHRYEHEENCPSCDRHKSALVENMRCGATWRGGDTCYYCQPAHVMELIQPTEAYLAYHEFPKDKIPQSVRMAWKRLRDN